jgi:hypothetical protein
MDQLAVAKPRAYGPNYPEVSNAIQEMLQAAISGQKPVDADVAWLKHKSPAAPAKPCIAQDARRAGAG